MKNYFVRKTFYRMLIPTILMNMVTCVSTAVNTIILGNFIGENALAAVTFSLPVFMLINTIAALLAVGGTTALGNALGFGDKEKANGIFSSAIITAAIVSVLLAAGGSFLIDPIVAALGAYGIVAELTREYTLIIFYLTPAFILNICLAFFVRSDGRPALAMTAMISSIAVNILLSILFVVVLNMGVAGAAWSAGLSQIFSALMMATHFFSKKNTLAFIAKGFYSRIPLIFKSGVGTSLHFIYQFIVILTFNHILVGISGAGAIVVFSVVINVLTIALSMFEGLSQSVQPMFSVYYGENNHRAIKETLKRVIKMTFILGGSVTAFLLIFPQTFTHIFGVTDALLVKNSHIAIRIFGTSIILMTINVIMGYYYQCIGRRKLAAFIVAAHNLIFQLLGAFLLVHFFGKNGVWLSYPFSEVAALAVWLSYAYWRGRRDKSGILLLPKAGKVFSSAQGSGEFLKQNGISDEIIAQIEAILDKFAKTENEVYISIDEGKQILLTIRNEGELLEESIFQPYIKTAKSFEYGKVLGINRVLVRY